MGSVAENKSDLPVSGLTGLGMEEDANPVHPEMLEATQGKITYTPAYDVLIHTIRRVGVEDDVSLLTPGEYHANTSELIQMLEKGHYSVGLDREAWSRLVTWTVSTATTT